MRRHVPDTYTNISIWVTDVILPDKTSNFQLCSCLKESLAWNVTCEISKFAIFLLIFSFTFTLHLKIFIHISVICWRGTYVIHYKQISKNAEITAHKPIISLLENFFALWCYTKKAINQKTVQPNQNAPF